MLSILERQRIVPCTSQSPRERRYSARWLPAKPVIPVMRHFKRPPGIQIAVRLVCASGFLDFAGAQAARADPDTFVLFLDLGPYALQVGFPGPFCHVVGMADIR